MNEIICEEYSFDEKEETKPIIIAIQVRFTEIFRKLLAIFSPPHSSWKT